MKIRPKNSILYAATGVRFSSANAGGANWRQQVFNNYRQHLLDQLAKYGEADDYGNWLNEMQHRHSGLWNAANQSGNWEDIAYENEDVGKYQQDYRGGLGNDNNYQRFGEVQLNPEDKYDFNQTGIKTNQATRYNIPDPPKRVSGDFSRKGYNYKVDNYYSAITDDRRLLGRKGDWDENSQEYKDWIKQLNDRGWTMELDESDQYYKLKRLGTPDPNNPEQNPQQNPNPQEEPKKPYSLTGDHNEKYGFDWNKIGEGLRKYGPDLLAAGRLAGNLWNNERVFKESEKGIRPDLKQTYYTHRQVVGDEATKQGYYRRAAQGQTAAARPFTSDADRQMAYQMEAKRVGDEMRAQGDLADNQEIRRTSDESNQHQWANTQRATEVANANTAAINYANALRQNLRAQKQSADWTSIDNELLARETRLRQKQARADAIRDQIWALDSQNKLQNDPEYLTAYDNYRNAYDKAVKKYTDKNGNVNYSAIKTDPEFRKAQQDYQNIQYRYQRQQLEDMLTRSAKEGMKFTFKSKDDLLYKTARDAADHFRKMSKISSDAHNRKRIKIEKLTSHPKGNARRKYQQGGAAPFTIYRPATLGGETTTSSQTGGTTTSSSKASSGKDKNDTLDMVKKLFEAVAGKGLPSDVNTLYNQMQGFLARAEAFGTDLSTDDIASMYLSQMQQLNTIQYMKADFDKAKEQASNNEALDEFAVTLDGKVVAQNPENAEIKIMSWDEVKKDKNFNPLTNRQILNIRALSPEYAFKNELLNVVGNGIGINKISEWIRTNLPTMGTSENKLEGYSNQESHKIIKGIEILKDAPAGDYKLSQLTKDQKEQAEAALKYIVGMMPRNMKAVLGIHADLSGTTPTELLTSLVSSKMSTTYQLDIDAVTGKAAKDANGNNKEGASDDIKSNPIMQMLQQRGGVPRTWEIVTRDSNVRMSVDGSYYSQIPKVTDDMSIDAMLATSGFSGVLDSKQGITFGDQNINPEQLKDVMYSNTGGMIVTLPCKIVNGHKEVNLGIKKSYEEALEEVESKGISRQSPEFNRTLGQVLKQKGLDSLLDSKGYPDKTKFAEFLVVEAYATSKVKNLDKQSQYIEKVKNPDSQLEQRLIRALSTNDKKDNYSLDIDYWLYGDDVYRGTMFIPLTNNLNASINAWGDQIKVDESEDLENKFQNFNKASTMKPSNSNVLYETK